MAKRMMRISTRDARLALRRLLRQLDKADLTGLTDRVSKGGKAKTAREWVRVLRDAEREIPEWCPNLRGDDQFTIDVPPKSRRR
jgi:hypothetical protein